MSKNGMVMIAMSGGVDSAVSAAKLLESGYEVEGLHMTNWRDDEPYCTASQDLQDAKNACKEIGIPMHHVDFSNEYRLGSANTDPSYNVVLLNDDSLIIHNEDFLKTDINWFETTTPGSL